jgi:hypothetical protein
MDAISAAGIYCFGGSGFMAEMAVRGGSLKATAIRYSHAGFAVLLVVFMWMGYSPFYLRLHSGFTNQPIVEGLFIYAVPHGIVATAWMLALVLQPSLIGTRNHKLHKQLGWWLLGLGAMVVVSGTMVAVKGASLEPESVVHGVVTYPEFILVMLTEMVAFTVLVATAVVNRKKPQIHRAMMMLTGLTILSAATDRTPWIMELTGGIGWWGMFAPELLLGLLFFVVRWSLTGKPDRWFGGGLAALMAALWLAFQLAPTAGWNAVLTSVFGF